MTTTQDSNNNYLEEIVEVSIGENQKGFMWAKLTKKTQKKINSHILSEALELIGEDEQVGTYVGRYGETEYEEEVARNQLRAELRKAFKDKYSKEESVGRENG